MCCEIHRHGNPNRERETAAFQNNQSRSQVCDVPGRENRYAKPTYLMVKASATNVVNSSVIKIGVQEKESSE